MGFAVQLNGTTLTREIVSMERADMAYNILYGMAEVGVKLNETPFDKTDLRLVDVATGAELKEPVDREWFGTEAERAAIKEAVLDKIMEDPNAGGRHLEGALMCEYTVSWRARDTATVYFMPNSWDMDKANLAYAVLHEDIDPELAFTMETDNGPVTLDRADRNLTNEDGDVPKPWDPDADNFADAINGLSEGDEWSL